jgi:DNA polymerase-3 subunit gamma/tau
MSLYNKYKPNNLEEILDQSFCCTILNNLMKSKNIPNGLILSGSHGVGKTSILNIFAKLINCTNPVNEKFIKACEKCKNCLFCENPNEDIIEIDGATYSGVESMRKIIESVNYLPFQLNHKIYIIDEVHMLSHSAFDALLLTLHNPPSNVHFFFATTRIDKIPQTFLSRCLLIQLNRIHEETIFNYLKKISNLKESILKLITNNCNGSVRSALSTLEVIMLCDNNDDLEIVEQYLKIISDENIIKIFKNILLGNSKEALELWNDLYKKGYDEKVFLHKLMETVKEITKLKIGIRESSNDNYQSLVEEFNITNELLCSYWDILMNQLEGLYSGCKNIGETTIILLTIVEERSSITNELKSFFPNFKEVHRI